jgi:hypothetical protein
MIKRTTIFNGLLGAFTALIFIAGALYMYATRIEQPYLYYQNLPFPIGSQVIAGEAVHLAVERCSRADETRSYGTTHTLTDVDSKQSVLLPNVEVSIEPGCHRSISKINVVPADTKAGRYIVGGVATVEGTFVTHKVAWYSEPFDVIAAPPAAKGEPGATGAAGPAGAKGATGAPGATGRQGSDGPPGATGAPGAKGSFWSK